MSNATQATVVQTRSSDHQNDPGALLAMPDAGSLVVTQEADDYKATSAAAIGDARLTLSSTLFCASFSNLDDVTKMVEQQDRDGK